MKRAAAFAAGAVFGVALLLGGAVAAFTHYARDWGWPH